MGNDDWGANFDALLEQDGALWRVLHERNVTIDGVSVAGLSWIPITPFGLKDWERWDDGSSVTVTDPVFDALPALSMMK